DNALKLIANLLPDGAVDRRMRPIRLADHDRITGIRSGPNRHVQWYLAEEGHPEPLRLVPRAAMAENVASLAAMRALEIAHVLNDAEHGHVDLLEHGKPPPRIDQRQILRRGDDDGALQRHVLRERQLRIARARGHVDHEHVERAPGDV